MIVEVAVDACVSLVRGSPSQVKVDPHRAQKPRHRPGDELNLVISPLATR